MWCDVCYDWPVVSRPFIVFVWHCLGSLAGIIFFMGGYALLTILGARCFFPAESEGLTWEFLNSPKHVLVPADTLKYIISPFLIGNISSNGPFPSIFQCYVSLPQCNSSCWWWRAINYTFDGNAANQLIWRSSHYLQGFYTFQVVQDFFHQP